MVDALVVTVTALMWVTVIVKGVGQRCAPENVALRALWLACLQSDLALSFFQPAGVRRGQRRRRRRRTQPR